MNKYLIFKKSRISNRIVILLCLLAVTPTSGCEPLRKKFVRKKKKSQETEISPLLDLIDYPAKQKDYQSKYRYHYSMWQVWHKDLMAQWHEKGRDKKKIYLVNQLAMHLEEMQKLLADKPQTVLTQYITELQEIAAELTKPYAIRNNDRIKQKLFLMEKQIRRNFKN